ncbi:hypothetical protein ALC60_02492 [Trachymyrmex zeteki]|uniref:Uncharacterized protein n=1 Tax=Mycetomoellerius zeteki TaxID=64791 RepID=A0A151XDJ8_9HYME|nr:PREDICTED: uncharacterized protein LOC108731820 [Trachymyrmex zeteki]KYQ58456.1 hypothetical protein ALC60_02492 [Trachymyrmex zeteki]
MITVEEDITKRPHFRLKVDLSKFFHDARRSCWIFIVGTKIQQINHLQQHISKLFNIAEPFHLLLNDTEYLPPIEDVRILKENETILVVPGSGINTEALAVVETSHVSIYDKQATNIKTGKQEMVAQNTFSNTLNNMQPTSINNTTKDMTFYSVISDTIVNYSEGDTDSKTTDNLTEDCNVIDSIVSIAKRKRVRKRKSKNRSRFIVSPSDRIEENTSKEPKLKKPKIIDSYIIPSGKHIRFNDIENNEHNIARQIVQEASRNQSYLNETSSSRDLSMLLTLGQSSTPITFINKKLKNEIETKNILNDEIRSKNLNEIMVEDSTEKISCNKESKKEIQSYKNLYADLEKVPIMTRKPQVNDIIAFKTLKIGTDYTPQVSNSILAEVVACVQSRTYTLRILHGKEEIPEVPFEKFSPFEIESESHPNEDTLIFNFSQMIEPRLIS